MRVLVINCGRCGLRGVAGELSVYAKEMRADVVVLNEVHMPPGEPVEVDGFQLVWAPRKSMVGKGPAGGVAFAVNLSARAVMEVRVEDVCQQADVAWARVVLGGTERPLWLAAVYFPPTGAEHCCPGCATGLCGRAHVAAGMSFLVETVTRLSVLGDVIVAGDFNAQAERQLATPRWREVQEGLVDLELVDVANPVDGSGCLLPTRRDPRVHTESVLDLVLVGKTNVSTVVVNVDRDCDLSDHFSLVIDMVTGVDTVECGLPADYGCQSEVPAHLRRKVMVAVSRQSDAMEFYKEDVDKALRERPAEVGTDVEEELAVLERVILEAAQRRQLCADRQRRQGRAAPQRVIVMAQRRLEKARRRLRVLEGLPADTAGLAGQLLQARQAVQALEEHKAAQLPMRRLLARAKLAEGVARRNAELQRLWVDGDVGMLARRMTADQRGLAAYRHPSPSVPLRQRQLLLARKVQHLTEKYGSAPATDWDGLLRRWPVVEADVVLPSLQEVRDAVQQLNGDSAAIGVPAFPVRWAATPTLLVRLHAAVCAIWQSGEVPASFCVAEAVALPKPGAKTDFRIIGVGGVLAKVFRLVMYNRTLAVVRPHLAASQFGFLPGKSTEQAVFVAASATRCAQAAGVTVEAAYVDIAGAYASVPWDVLLVSMAEMGVPPDILHLTASYLCQQRLFVKVGNLCSGWIRVSIGLTEGDPMSPLEFIIVVNEPIRRMEEVARAADNPVGLPMADGGQLTSVTYADDVTVRSSSAEGLQLLLSACGAALEERHLRINAAPSKSACQRFGAWDKGRRSRAVQQRGTVVYSMQGKPLPYVACYKHLGVYQHASGPWRAVCEQVRRVAVAAATVVRRVLAVPVAQRSVGYVARLYVVYWLPTVTYALGLWAESPPRVLADMESTVLRVVMKAANTPLVALRSVVGLPTWQTRLDLDRVRVLLQFLRAPAGTLVKQQLFTELQLYDGLVETAAGGGRAAVKAAAWARKLWWSRTMEVLATMDAAADGEGDRLPVGGASWRAWARAAVQRWQETLVVSKETALAARRALLEVEARRRAWEIQRCRASLQEVAELIDTPNVAPFTVDTRRDMVILRAQLRGGRRVVFGHQYFHLLRCPWCTEQEAFNLRHLVQDCPVWEETRMAAWGNARAVAVAEGVKVAASFQLHRGLWYRFTCGAAVPDSFLGLGLDSPTHFARGSRSASRHLRLALPVYQRMLGLVGVFLRELVMRTRARLEEGKDGWEYGPEAEAGRVTINHAARERAELGLGVVVGAGEGSDDSSVEEGGDEDGEEEGEEEKEEDGEDVWDGVGEGDGGEGGLDVGGEPEGDGDGLEWPVWDGEGVDDGERDGDAGEGVL